MGNKHEDLFKEILNKLNKSGRIQISKEQQEQLSSVLSRNNSLFGKIEDIVGDYIEDYDLV